MNGSSRHSRIVEVIIDEVNLLLAVDENQGTNRRHADKKVIDRAHLLVPINPDDLQVSLSVSIELEPHKSLIIFVVTYILHNVVVRTPGSANAEAHMVLAEVFLCKRPELLVEGSREHQVAVIIVLVHIFLKSATLKRRNA